MSDDAPVFDLAHEYKEALRVVTAEHPYFSTATAASLAVELVKAKAAAFDTEIRFNGNYDEGPQVIEVSGPIMVTDDE